MHVGDPEFSGEFHERRRIVQIVPQQHHRDRRTQARRHRGPNAVSNPVECAGAANRIVDFRRGAVEADLDAEPLGREGRQRAKTLALENRAVRHDHQVALASLDDVVDEIDRVGPGQRLAAGEVNPLDAQRDGLIDGGADDLPGQALRAIRGRRDQTMFAGEVAVVVDLDPELVEPIRAQEGRPAGIRHVGGRRRPVDRQEPLTERVTDEGVHVQPRPGRIELCVRGVGADDRAEGGAAVQPLQNAQSPFVCGNPVRCRGIDRDDRAPDPLDNRGGGTETRVFVNRDWYRRIRDRHALVPSR